MQFQLASFVMGVLVGSLLSVAIAIPRVGRILARFATVLLFIAGIGFLTLGIVSIVWGGEFTSISLDQISIDAPAEALGIGGGLLAGGILALVLSFIRTAD